MSAVLALVSDWMIRIGHCSSVSNEDLRKMELSRDKMFSDGAMMMKNLQGCDDKSATAAGL